MVAKKSTQQVKRALPAPASANKSAKKTPVKNVVLTCRGVSKAPRTPSRVARSLDYSHYSQLLVTSSGEVFTYCFVFWFTAMVC